MQLIAVHRHTSRIRVQGAYFSTRASSFLVLVVRIITDKDFARPGRSCSFLDRGVIISQT